MRRPWVTYPRLWCSISTLHNCKQDQSDFSTAIQFPQPFVQETESRFDDPPPTSAAGEWPPLLCLGGVSVEDHVSRTVNSTAPLSRLKQYLVSSHSRKGFEYTFGKQVLRWELEIRKLSTTFGLNAPVVIRTKEKTNIAIHNHALLRYDTCHWRSKVGEDCSFLPASSSQWSSNQGVLSSPQSQGTSF